MCTCCMCVSAPVSPARLSYIPPWSPSTSRQTSPARCLLASLHRLHKCLQDRLHACIYFYAYSSGLQQLYPQLAKKHQCRAMWFNITSPGFLILLNILQFRVVLQSCLKARGVMKVTAQGVSRMLPDGYKITTTWLVPAAASETSRRHSSTD